MNIIPVILSGGEGSRLWPISRQLYPKPFIRIKGKRSLLQQCYMRALNIPGVKEVITVTNDELFFKTIDEYRELRLDNPELSFLLEPVRRNSAPASLLAAQFAQKKDDPILLLMPSDHLVENQALFNEAVLDAAMLAEQGYIATFGIMPTRPETGYGYLHRLDDERVEFIEKPSFEKALNYLEAGDFFWNSGMFCMKASTLIAEAEKYCPDIYTHVEHALKKSEFTENEEYKKINVRSADYKMIKGISIDYAIMELSHRIRLIPAQFDWYDIGSFHSLAELYPKDQNGNHIDAETILENVQNCYIKGDKRRLIAGINVKNLMIIDTHDALLVADKSQPQDIKCIYERLKAIKHPTQLAYPMVYRPWGTYCVLEESDAFKVKKIIVKPQGKLSLQSHAHRNEHWVIVQGSAKVTLGEKNILISENDALHVPVGFKHRIENLGEKDLIIIEVQYGSYLGEDDIIRFEDIYERKKGAL